LHLINCGENLAGLNQVNWYVKAKLIDWCIAA